MFSVDMSTTTSHPFPRIGALCSSALSSAWQFLSGATVAITYFPRVLGNVSYWQ